jgi:hypothetical protein
MTNDNTQKVEVFQPRDPGQFYDRENDEATSEMFHTLRDLRGGFIEAEDISFEKFGLCYDLVGTEEVDGDRFGAERPADMLHIVFERWQNAEHTRTSDTFREMNKQARATSLSPGDIVRVNGTAYLCESVGWSEVEEVST